MRIGLWGGGKRNRNPGSAAFAIRGCNASSVGARDSIDECQAKAVPARIPALHAALEQMRKHLGIESRAIVFQNQRCCILFAPQFDRERAVGRQVIQFVVKEIGNHAMKKRGIGDEFSPGRCCAA